MDIEWRPVPILAPVFAAAAAPIFRAIGADLARVILAGRAAEITCDRCRDVIALWSPTTGLLHFPAPDGIGVPLPGDQARGVDIWCARCDKIRATTSARRVGRNLHNGRPPLA